MEKEFDLTFLPKGSGIINEKRLDNLNNFLKSHYPAWYDFEPITMEEYSNETQKIKKIRK